MPINPSKHVKIEDKTINMIITQAQINQEDEKGLAKKPCDFCKKIKKRCSKTLPSCTKCLSKGIVCHYRKMKPTQKEMKKEFFEDIETNVNISFVHLKPLNTRLLENGNDKGFNINVLTSKWNNLIPIQIKNELFSMKYTKLILRKSMVDTGKVLFMFDNGRPMYYGRSPAGNLITLFFSLNNSNEQNNINANFEENLTTVNNHMTKLNINLSNAWNYEECVNAYFEQFNPYCPVLTYKYFKKFATPLLKNAVTVIGLKYLNQGRGETELAIRLDNKVREQFLLEYFKPSLSLVITIALLSQYQVIKKEFKNMWIHQGHGIYMAKLLGLTNICKLKEHPEVIEIKKRVWVACSVRDKMFANALNRPILIPPYSHKIPELTDNLKRLPPMSEEPNKTEKSLATEIISQVHWRGMVRLSQFMGSSIILNRISYNQSPSKASKLFDDLHKKMLSWYAELLNEMRALIYQQPNWVKGLEHHFTAHLMIIMHNIIIQSSHHFLTHSDLDLVKKHRKISLESANAIVLFSTRLGESFFLHGILYRFYALCSACLVFVHLSRVCDHKVKQQCLYSLNIGLGILKKGTEYFEFVKEYYFMITGLLNNSKS